MTTGKLSVYPSFVRFDKTPQFRRQRVAAYVFTAIAIGAAVFFIKSCAPGFIHAQEALLSTSKYSSSDGQGFWGFIVMIAAYFLARVSFSRDGGEEYIQSFHSAVISEHVAVVDPGSGWRAWPLSWAGGWCGISESTLLVYSFDRDTIVTIPMAEVAEAALTQRQISAESQIVGGAIGSEIVGVGGGVVHTQFIVSWVIDIYLRSDANAHVPLSFAQNEASAKEFYGQLRHRGCLCA